MAMMASQSSSRPSTGNNPPPAASSSGIPTRSVSTSTLPSIRSLRKAFQFTSTSNSNNRHHSIDGYAASAKDDFRRSTGSSRTISGSLPRPSTAPHTIPTTLSSSSSTGPGIITKSTSVGDMNALTGSGTAPISGPEAGAAVATAADIHNSGIKNAHNNYQHIKALPARPLSAQTIPEHRAVIYSSSIPVNSRPPSTSASNRSTPPRTEKKQPQPSPPLPDATSASSASAAPSEVLETVTSEDGVQREQPSQENEEMPIMHISTAKGSTPPPIIPLPPVPNSHEDTSVLKTQTQLPLATKRAWPSMNLNRNSLEVPRSREGSSISILDEKAPDSFDRLQADDLSISSPPSTSSRPTISRSRSAIESIKAIAAEADIFDNNSHLSSSSARSQNGSSRSRQSSLPKPIIMESPSRSPAVMDANKTFNFPLSSSAESVHIVDVEDFDGSSSPNAPRALFLDTSSSLGNSSGELQNSTYVRGLRNSSTSPLSELVQRLNVQSGSPIKEDVLSPISITHDMDTSDIRSEEDPSEAHYKNGDIPNSPFIPQSMIYEDEGASNIEDASVEGSSGISANPPSRIPPHLAPYAGTTPQQRHTFERLSGGRVSQDRRASSAGSGTKSTHIQEFEKRVSPQTEKRWSMAEVEAAYGRIRRLATRRSSAAPSEAPSFLISEDSKDLAPSYVQHLIDRGFPLDASMTSSGGSNAPSGPSSDIGHSAAAHTDGPQRDEGANLNSSTDREEAGDALTPLVGARDRYSPSTSPRVSPRALSPQTFVQFPSRSPRNSYVDSRAESPYSSGTASSSRGKSSSAAWTAPTTARHSQESESKLLYTAPPILRSVSDQSEKLQKTLGQKGSGWLRRASVEASSAASSGAGSDDTGWVTPKTSAGDAMGRRRSVSPALTATRRGSSATDHYDETPHHTTTAQPTARRASSTRQRRPVSYSSSAGTDSLPGAGQYGRNGSYRYTHGPSHSVSQSSLWFDDTPKAASKARPSIPSDFRGNMAAHPHRREASSYSTSGSTYSLDSLATSSFAEAKKADKIDLFLRCTKAESALQAITAHSQIEREALLDALQESRAMIDALRQQNEELLTELDHARRQGARKPAEQSQEAARRVAEIVEARDEWQARAQAMERDLAFTKHTQQKHAVEAEAALATMRDEITRLQKQLTAQAPKSPPKTFPRAAASALPRRSSQGSNPLKISMSPSGLPRSTGALRNSTSGLPRSRHSSGTNSNGFSPHGRTISNASSTFQTDFGDHLPAVSDGWSLGDSQDASLRLDDSTARFLQDIEGQSVRSRQKSTTSSKRSF